MTTVKKYDLNVKPCLLKLNQNNYSHYLKKVLKRKPQVSMIDHLCNLSTTFRTFPAACSIAKLNLLLKKRTSRDPKNYQPISLLPLISKVQSYTWKNYIISWQRQSFVWASIKILKKPLNQFLTVLFDWQNNQHF